MRHANDNASAIVANSGAANDNRPLTFISMFSGIEAASVAFKPLGWRALAVAEIEKFPSAVLAHHYPDVPNVGDMTAHDWSQYAGKVDIVCGGPPCQAFSVAGLRNSMADARGNLSLSYMRALHAIKPRNAIVENVPGWLSTSDNAFGCFLAGLVGADDALRTPDGKSWPNAGMVAGPLGRAAWRVLDAQYFGLAQRRRRVIVVADFGNGADPAAVLFERQGVHGNTPPSREKGEGVAAAVARSVALRGREGGGTAELGDEVAGTLRASSGGGDKPHALTFAPEIARCVATREGSSQDYESTTMVAQQVYSIMPQNSGKDYKARPVDVAQPLMAGGPVGGNQGGDVVCVTGDVSHALTAEGHDASEDGSERGTPIVAFNPRATDVPVYGDQSGALDASYPGPAICFTAKDYGADAQEDLAPTLRSGGHDKSHAKAGVMPAIAWAPETYSTLSASEGGTMTQIMPIVTSAVRRLTPRECERLQGFPYDYTAIPWRGKPAEECPDGPRYKALGNSWAVPKFRWLGERIQRFMPANDNEAQTKKAA